jgi:hypothetical protein
MLSGSTHSSCRLGNETILWRLNQLSIGYLRTMLVIGLDRHTSVLLSSDFPQVAFIGLAIFVGLYGEQQSAIR